MFSSDELKVRYWNHSLSDWGEPLQVLKSVFHKLHAYNLYTNSSSSKCKDWYVRQGSRNEGARNWAGQESVLGNGPVMGDTVRRGRCGRDCAGELLRWWKPVLKGESRRLVESGRDQEQRRGYILCPLHLTQWTEEDFNRGRVEGSENTGGIQNPGWTSLRVREGQQWLESNGVMLLELWWSARCQLMMNRYSSGDSSGKTSGVAHVLRTESGTVIASDVNKS